MSFREWQVERWPGEIVDAAWMHDGAPMGIERTIPPDNCADLLFLFDDEGRVTSASVVGAMSRPLVVSGGATRSLGVRFRPGWLPPLLGVTGAELRDQSVPIGDFLGMDSLPRVEPGVSRLEVVAPIIERLLRRAEDGAGPPPLVREALHELSSTCGRVPIARLCNDLRVTRQHLAREFSRSVGVGPKFAARVMRVAAAARDASAGISWSRIAHESGFADQSHLSREFVALRGHAPTELHLRPA